MPAFHEGTLLGFACVRAHWPDIGSATPGSYGATTEIFGEGLRLPPVRLYAAGVPNPDVDASSSPTSAPRTSGAGDLRAQMAANQRGVLRLQSWPRSTARPAARHHARGHGLLRAPDARHARPLPDGTAFFEDFCDGDGIIEEGEKEDRTFRIRLQVTKGATASSWTSPAPTGRSPAR